MSKMSKMSNLIMSSDLYMKQSCVRSEEAPFGQTAGTFQEPTFEISSMGTIGGEQGQEDMLYQVCANSGVALQFS